MQHRFLLSHFSEIPSFTAWVPYLWSRRTSARRSEGSSEVEECAAESSRKWSLGPDTQNGRKFMYCIVLYYIYIYISTVYISIPHFLEQQLLKNKSSQRLPKTCFRSQNMRWTLELSHVSRSFQFKYSLNDINWTGEGFNLVNLDDISTNLVAGSDSDSLFSLTAWVLKN